MSKETLKFLSRTVTVIVPDKPCSERSWVWRAEFLGAFDSVDNALLVDGWHVVHFDVSNMYGCEKAIDLMKSFHDFIVEKYGLNLKSVLFGFSRGGLYAVNYAAKYPSDVAALYFDAPVLDIRSWPLGLRSGNVWEAEAAECLACYNLALEEAENFNDNPLNKTDALIAAQIPVILVSGDSDMIVPYKENGAIFAAEYEKKGGVIKTILKEGCGHHPHSLETPAEIVEFIKCYVIP